jgi:hypothetical protein
MRGIIEASKNSNISLINSDTRKIQEAINESWIFSSTNFMTECVYFVQAGVGGYIKIGRSVKSTGFNSRLVALQTSCPIPLRSLVELVYDEYEIYKNYGGKALHDYLFANTKPDEYVDYATEYYNRINYPLLNEKRQFNKSGVILEGNLHDRFDACLSMSEWFYPSIELLEFIYEIRKIKISESSVYNPKKAAIVPCIVCDNMTFSSTLKCRSHGSDKRRFKCRMCGDVIDTPKWMKTITCESCYYLYVEKTRKFHKTLFV